MKICLDLSGRVLGIVSDEAAGRLPKPFRAVEVGPVEAREVHFKAYSNSEGTVLYNKLFHVGPLPFNWKYEIGSCCAYGETEEDCDCSC